MPKLINNIAALETGTHFLIAENGFYYEKEPWYGEPDPKPTGNGVKHDIVKLYLCENEQEWTKEITDRTIASKNFRPMKVVVPAIRQSVEVVIDI
jgi:hypothetical protein